MIDRAEAFWREHVETGHMPAVSSGEESVQRTLARLFPTHSEQVDAATLAEEEALQNYFMARAGRERYEAEEGLHKATLMQLIGGRSGIQAQCGKVTWRATKGRALTDYEQIVEAIGKVHPDLVNELVREHTRLTAGGRRFLLTPAKKAA